MTANYSNIIYGYTGTPSGNHSFLPLRTYNGKTRPHEGVDIPAPEGREYLRDRPLLLSERSGRRDRSATPPAASLH
jgi:hypothetical protein